MPEGSAHKRAVRSAFDRAASDYDRAAAVQRETCARLFDLARMWAPLTQARRVVDAGCGTGHALAGLAALYPGALRIALDFSPAMLARASAGVQHKPAALALCADLECLPLAAASIDVLWSSLALQWCAPDAALGEVARVLRPGGLALIATLGPRTLHELDAAFSVIDDAAHVIDFHPASHWQRCATAAGLEVLASTNDETAAVAADLRSLLHDIKAIGAHTVSADRRRKPLGKAAWRRLEQAYEGYRRTDGLLPASYDLILLALRKPT